MTTPASPRSAAPRQLADILLGLAGAMQRLRALPPGHPVIVAGIAALERALETVLEGRDRLTVEVGTVQLVVDGMESNPDFEPLRDLADELREAGIRAIEFRPGVGAGQLLAVFSAIANHNGGRPAWPAVPHITIRSLTPAMAPGADPWLPLERVVLDEPERRTAEHDPEELAFALELLAADAERDSQILDRLGAVARAAVNSPEDAEALDRLLTAVPHATLRRLLAPRADLPSQGNFLRSIAGHVSAPVLLRLLEATAYGREAQLSPAALQVLARVAKRTEGRDQAGARRALGDELARLAPVVDPQVDLAGQFPRLAPEPERVLKLALESGILEPGTIAAADRMIARGQVAPLLGLLETVPEEDPIARAIHARVYHPDTVRVLLGGSPIDLDLLDRLIPEAGLGAAPALLDALAESRDRRVRLRLLDLLARYREAVGPLAAERLDGMPWYVQRNVLALLGRLPDRPMRYTPPAVLAHRDPRVRHEAIALSIADPAMRTRGLVEALDSNYEPTLRLALTSLAEQFPAELLPRVIALSADPRLDPEIRAMAVTALSRVSDPVVLRLLRRQVVARGIPGFGRLAPKSPSMLAALRGLAAHWQSHPKVVPLLEAARQSRDPEIRAAARLPTRRSSASIPRAAL